MGILRDVLIGVGLQPENTDFRDEIVMHTNSALDKLEQLGGIQPGVDYYIDGESTAEWNTILKPSTYRMAVSYVVLSVRLVFDPSSSATITESLTQTVEEMGYRIRTKIEDDELLINEVTNAVSDQ